jgi:hypothetical protein
MHFSLIVLRVLLLLLLMCCHERKRLTQWKPLQEKEKERKNNSKN